jgi:hypothetical protein
MKTGPVNNEVFCIGCKHIRPSAAIMGEDAESQQERIRNARCAHQKAFKSAEAYFDYLVMGEKALTPERLTYCNTMRRTAQPCTPLGLLYEPKPPEVITVPSPPTAMNRQGLYSRFKKILNRLTHKPIYP